MTPLTRLPKDLQERLRSIDPARSEGPIEAPAEVLTSILDGSRRDDGLGEPVREAVVASPVRARPRLGWAIAASVALVLAVGLGVPIVKSQIDGPSNDPTIAADGTGGTAGSTSPDPGTVYIGPALPAPVPNGILTPAEALAKWASFPVTANPRPLVITQSGILVRFDDQVAKLAFSAGAFTLQTTLPTTTTSPSGTSVISAADAFAQLRAQGSGTAATTLVITGAALTTTEFATDRGATQLPVWSFTIAGVTGPVMVLAVPASSRWATLENPSGTTATITGNTLAVTFYGAPPISGGCGADYSVKTTSSDTAVVLAFTETGPPSTSKSAIACPALAAQRTVSVTLASALGNRVLTDTTGGPIAVTQK
jgi:hypothetical protein